VVPLRALYEVLELSLIRREPESVLHEAQHEVELVEEGRHCSASVVLEFVG